MHTHMDTSTGAEGAMVGCSVDRPGVADDAALDLSDEFMQYNYKVEACMLSHPHGWKVCPFVHPGEPVKRRHPSTHRGDMCPAVKKGLHCQVGPDNCPYAHNSFELWLHPSRYKTKMCRRGAECPRGICFFAHSESELRQRVTGQNKTPAVTVVAAANKVTTPGAAPVATASPVPAPLPAPAAVAAPGPAPATPAVPAAVLPQPVAAGGSAGTLALSEPERQLLLLQQQYNEMKRQHELEMQRMQEKMLLLQFLQEQEQQVQGVAPNTACLAVKSNSLLAPVNCSTGIVPADPISTMRFSAAATTAALLGNFAGDSNPLVQLQLQQLSNGGKGVWSDTCGTVLPGAACSGGMSASMNSSPKGSNSNSRRSSNSSETMPQSMLCNALAAWGGAPMWGAAA